MRGCQRSQVVHKIVSFRTIVWQHVKTCETAAVTLRILASVLAGQKSSSQRAPYEHADSRVMNERFEIEFEVAAQQRVVKLRCTKLHGSGGLLNLHGFRSHPGRPVGESDVAHFTLLHQ